MKACPIFSLLLCAVLSGAPMAHAAEYPSGPIVIISPYAPGDAVDNTARVFADNLAKELDTNVVVQNVTGGSGVIGMKNALKANPDGQTLVMAVAGALINAPLTIKPGFTTSDFTPLAKLTEQPFAIAVKADSKYKTLDDLVKDAKSKTLKFSTPGASSTQRMVISEFANVNGFKPMRHIAGQGGGDTVTKVLTGEVDLAFTSIPVFYPLVKGGKLRLLAVGTDERLPYLPDQPTFKEQGYTMNETLWFGLAVRDGVAPEILDKLNTAVKNACTNGKMEEALEKFKITTSYLGPEEFAALVNETVEKRTAIMKDLGLIK